MCIHTDTLVRVQLVSSPEFDDWLDCLAHQKAKARILARLRRAACPLPAAYRRREIVAGPGHR
jgi:putative component of toxin-antitoxin plasmid stabilization module